MNELQLEIELAQYNARQAILTKHFHEAFHTPQGNVRVELTHGRYELVPCD